MTHDQALATIHRYAEGNPLPGDVAAALEVLGPHRTLQIDINGTVVSWDVEYGAEASDLVACIKKGIALSPSRTITVRG